MDDCNDLAGYEIYYGEPLSEPESKTVQLEGKTGLVINSERKIISVKKIIKITEQVWP